VLQTGRTLVTVLYNAHMIIVVDLRQAINVDRTVLHNVPIRLPLSDAVRASVYRSMQCAKVSDTNVVFRA